MAMYTCINDLIQIEWLVHKNNSTKTRLMRPSDPSSFILTVPPTLCILYCTPAIAPILQKFWLWCVKV